MAISMKHLIYQRTNKYVVTRNELRLSVFFLLNGFFFFSNSFAWSEQAVTNTLK